ncbi:MULTISPECIES: TrbG/VirB9 family P-type conjugative transfer protein [unclassified Brevundimonas]|uniref:TrbG/VirB9 family P-type conjugative transfer protein n=1 Tax=unclassified Brevundimonas TaxID=2622653 RepID=UPI000CFAA153|nr:MULTISPECIES: TrbG/VirB9 family P-type conjugative transfer protein [unclassified Brevundimonas]PRA27669.1 conjugal transfer protein [Brevundimonas sp. MYb27]PQZ74967.1 conjugal transfer protein [Brevundimonas sp. MYb31]PRB17613.1 conjugal transfer protein [Brevundimonas sp. MYb52]PRB37985.1 conjugal transfer protein [Brevundimonas sp. MYb46]PRB45385.1 conjugal transfer protein [Brevundimonas sp. MYb33]
MKALVLSISLGALTLASPTLAQEMPDARMREVVYAPGEVYRVAGAFRTATQIVFSPEETIRHAAIGDSVAWEVAAEGSVLFLKPRERHQTTNLLVVTDRAGQARHYAFELVARDPGARASIAYQIRFLYPDDDQARAVAGLARAADIAEQGLISLELQQGAVLGPRNLAYSVQGDSRLQPSEVSDNGRFTILRFPGAQAIPALFEIGEDGSERLIPYDVRGEFVVIHGTARALRLRRGASVLCIFNDAWDTRGVAMPGGTASPMVERAPTGGRP